MGKRTYGAPIALILFTIFLPNASGLFSATIEETVISSPSVTITSVASAAPTVTGTPSRLIIPSISLDAPIEDMGLNNKGELDVPNGQTKDVGWYKDGPLPGQVGSAVLDAHVFAAFKKLKFVTPGSDVYVVTTTGQRLHFIVETAKTYPLKKLSPVTLFGLNDKGRLNLITCAGALTADRSTYDHRLVVFTSFVGIEKSA